MKRAQCRRRNSLVFHSLDKITSLFLHLFPAGVVWTERWHPDVVRLQFPPASAARTLSLMSHGFIVVLRDQWLAFNLNVHAREL